MSGERIKNHVNAESYLALSKQNEINADDYEKIQRKSILKQDLDEK